MRKLFVVIVGVWIAAFGASSANAQAEFPIDSDWNKFMEMSEAEANGNIGLAGNYAAD